MTATAQTAIASVPQRRLAGNALANTPGECRSKPRRVGVALGSAALWFGQLARSAWTTAVSFCSTTAIGNLTLQPRRDGVVRSPAVMRSRSTSAATTPSASSRTRGDEPELASYLRIEERELKVGGGNQG
jgi:hypothetical protein